ncbi:mitochondrial import inner membrane translocase subunit tim21, partial [Linderina macrospora]
MQRAAIANTCRRILLGQAFAARGFANRAAPSVTGAPIYLTRAQQKQQPHQKHTQYRTYASSSRGQEIASTAGNLLIVSSVVGMFGYIVYVLYDNMFAEHGVTRVYNESLDLIRANPQVTELLGGTISGFGEPTHSQRQRQRSIAHREFIDPQGRKRLSMKYYIEDAHHLAP